LLDGPQVMDELKQRYLWQISSIHHAKIKPPNH
jgi:hypothetical protein